MSVGTTARAPGKLFLLGEYAVLYGGPAIVQAVDRYVLASVEAIKPGSDYDLEVSARGARFAPLRAVFNQTLSYDSTQPEHDLVVTILDALVASGVVRKELGPIRCTIDSRELFHQRQKLGLGSSAAVTHAFVRALAEFSARYDAANETSLPSDFVFNVHRAFQHGRGSGADIGAGFMGGTFSYRRATEHTLPDMEAVTLPADLHMTPVWVGRPASTAQALGTVSDFQAAHPGRFTAALTPLLELAEQGVHALVAGDAGHFVRVCDDYGHNLSEFGRTVGVDIMSDAHKELRKIAKACDVVYKPSGAGNGDFGLGYSIDIKALDYFEGRVRSAGFTLLKLKPGKPCHLI